MTDADDLMQRMADCIQSALEIIDGDRDDVIQDWIGEAEQLIIEHRDMTPLQTSKPPGRERAIIVPVIGGREARRKPEP
jgi:hypothetical protein